MQQDHADPPESLSLAEAQFKAFLAENGYPPAIRWVFAGDVVTDTRMRCWVRERHTESVREAQSRYVLGITRQYGIEMHALCASDAETFATVYIPTDATDAEYRLIGRGLKLSCAIPKRKGSVVRNRIKWWLLWKRNGQGSALLWA